MSEFKEFLFIGGCADGEVFKVALKRDTVEIHKYHQPWASSYFGEDIDKPDFPTDTYEKEFIRGKSDVFSVFKASSISVDEMIKKLIEGYRP